MAFETELLRPDDLVHLRISGANLVLDASDASYPVIVVEDKTRPAYLTVGFPAQTVTEPAYFEVSKIAAENKDADGTELHRKDPDAATVLTEALDPPGKPAGKHHAAAIIGHPSRLVFEVPPEARIPYSLAGLLDWSAFDLSVSPIAAIGPKPSQAQIDDAPDIRPPHATETSIELPHGLVISPNTEASWRHRTTSFTWAGRTELWHTRLALKDDDERTELSRLHPAPLRAIWSDDYTPDNPPPTNQPDPDLGRTAMSANDRYQLVVLTSAFHGWLTDSWITVAGFGELGRNPIPFDIILPHLPEPFEAEQLMLSPLGGWLKSRGQWTPPRPAPAPDVHRLVNLQQILSRPRLGVDTRLGPRVALGPAVVAPANNPPTQLDLSEWVHLATLGRDHYVRIVYEGELWPFRHQASLVKVTERKFKETNGVVAAYLVQRMFIVVREPEKTFSDRGNPFKKVRLTTLVTPNIVEPVPITGTNRSFWVEVMTGDPATNNTAYFPFHGVATDAGDFEVDFTVPLMFVSLSDVGTPVKLQAVADAYNSSSTTALRNLNVPGQKVVFAKPAGNDNTRLVTDTVNFIVDKTGSPPQMLKAEVRVEQVRELLGTDKPTTIAFWKPYVDGDFDAATGVFARIAKLTGADPVDTLASMVEDSLGVEFSADKAGGFATPNMRIEGLTRKLGPVAGRVADAVVGTFDPAAFFPAKTAFLFSTFDLTELLAKGDLGQKAPTMITERVGTDLVTRLTWDSTVEKKDGDIAAFLPGKNTRLKVNGEIRKPLDGTPPTSKFHGTLNNFDVGVLKCVFIKFDEFAFDARTGSKTDVTVRLNPLLPVRFAGDLEFVEEIRNAIPPELFGDGPSLDISPTGIRAGFSFALPPLAVGVFALKDVSLGAALTLPFLDGKPVFDFNISERAHPFLLTVSLFAGGGFFHLQLDTAGMKALEVALEFGAAAAIDIGVASGEVHIMAGIYFKLERKEGESDLSAVLSGYLRMGGSLSVLGLITVSVEFNLSFTYDKKNDKAFGRATLTVQVEVVCFSKSVELTVERGFGGSSDPTFGQLVTSPDLWSEYANAFA